MARPKEEGIREGGDDDEEEEKEKVYGRGSAAV